MKRLRVAGVPEHFNFPWHLAGDRNLFEKAGIDLYWTDVPEGTGKMRDMLRDDQADLAIMLCEGAIKAISDGLDARIIQEFIGTPLLWGIHVAFNSEFSAVGDLVGKRAAISRPGSGSHLMACVNAKLENWDPGQLGFVAVDTLEGAVNALNSGSADYFMWERFTTQPLVDQQVFRRIGTCPTPWPCFVIVGTSRILSAEPGLVAKMLTVINKETNGFKGIAGIDRLLAKRYGQELADIREWLELTEWSQKQISIQTIKKVMVMLDDLKLLGNMLPVDRLLGLNPATT